MFSLAVPEEQNPVQPYDPIMINEVNSVVAHYKVVRGMPVTVNLDRAGQVAIIGDRKRVLCAARSMIVQLAALHAPDDEMAVHAARDVYTRRNEGVSIWVVRAADITASSPDEKDPMFAPSGDKVYRHPTFYEIPDNVPHM